MTDHDIQLLLIDLALIIVLARLLGEAARRIGQPPVLGEIVAGILLGPTLFSGRVTNFLFPALLRPPLTAIATLGLTLFMFVVGYEVDLRLVRGHERVAVGVSVGSIIAPLGLGAGLGVWLAHRHHVAHVSTFALFIGVAMSVTAFPVLARILTDRGMHRTRIGGLALASASVDDVLAWVLLAVVFTLAGSGHSQVKILLAPVYLAVMIFVVRPLLRKLAGVHRRQGRLTPTVLAAVLVGLLVSAFATDWMGVKYIFGAFLFGMIMPRDDGAALRQAILERLEQISVLVLLPVFFVVAGLSVNLSSVGTAGLTELGLILVVAIAGKMGGAYIGAKTAGVSNRQAGTLATLMNTRGLTEIVILAIGLQLHILPKSVYSLMVVMAILTTAMAGPLLRVIYPAKIMARDKAAADRALLGQPAAHRIVVLIEDVETAGPPVDVGVRLAAARPNSELILSHLVPQRRYTRLEVGTGIGGELLQMTQTMGQLHQLVARASARGVTAVVQARFSDNVPAELPGYVAAAQPDTIVLGADGTVVADGRLAEQLSEGGTVQLVSVLRPLPEQPEAVAARVARGDNGAAAVQVAALLAVADRLALVLSPPGGPQATLAAELSRHQLPASDGDVPAAALVVAAAGDAAGAADSPAAHVSVLAGTNEGSDDTAQWVQALEGAGSIEQH